MSALKAALMLVLGSLPAVGTVAHDLHHALDACGSAVGSACPHAVQGPAAERPVSDSCAGDCPLSPRPPCEGCSICRVARTDARPLHGHASSAPVPTSITPSSCLPAVALPAAHPAATPESRCGPPADWHPVVLPLRD